MSDDPGIQTLMTKIAARPRDKKLIRACIDHGMCLAKITGGPADGTMLWTAPGPPDILHVDGLQHHRNGIIPNSNYEAWAEGFFLWAYVPPERAIQVLQEERNTP